MPTQSVEDSPVISLMTLKSELAPAEDSLVIYLMILQSELAPVDLSFTCYFFDYLAVMRPDTS